jgi:hypothetical protein
MARTAAAGALQEGLEGLRAVLADPEADPDTKARAAEALTKLALAVLTKTPSGGERVRGPGGDGEPRDLFDAAAELGPWRLTVVK